MEKTTNCRPKMTAKARRAVCAHQSTIELHDGTRVCTCCEAVVRGGR